MKNPGSQKVVRSPPDIQPLKNSTLLTSLSIYPSRDVFDRKPTRSHDTGIVLVIGDLIGAKFEPKHKARATILTVIGKQCNYFSIAYK